VTNTELDLKLKAIAGGDKKAFEELYNGMKTPVFAIIYRIIWDKSLSEDVMQELFFKLYVSPPSPPPKNPRAYIFQMARNLAINSAKKLRTDLSLDDIGEVAHSPFDGIVQQMDIDNALKSLNSESRQIVLLHVIGGFKHREIAEMMEIPLGTALWKYQQALSKMRKIISET